MKHVINFSVFGLSLVAFSLGSCTIDIEPQSGTLTSSQLEETTSAVSSRAEAVFTGMYTKLGDPLSYAGYSTRPDNFGFIMMAIANDLEGSDVSTANSGYNWFSNCMLYTSRNADYANPYMRYRAPYDEISRCHDVINAYGEITDEMDADTKYMVAQAYAVRAFCYLSLAPSYQFSYQIDPDAVCVPIVTLETEDFSNNPRASLRDVYDLIVSDLTYAIQHLEGYVRPDKAKVDQQVAYGLRARAYLDMGMWPEAAADAAKAAEGYTPATIAEVSVPSFYNINDHNWIWGYDMTTDVASTFPYATASSWIRSFSSNSYSAGVGIYWRINNLLYDKIPADDVRKGWWVDENLESPLLDGLTWSAGGVTLTDQEIATGTIDDIKFAFDTHTNVKFGMNTIGGTNNDEDWPFMRVEEMLLIQAEALVRSNNVTEGLSILNDFVKNYRYEDYEATSSGYDGRTLLDEIWFQRRVELWGEGFSTSDIRRLQKPIVRFHSDSDSNFPDAYQINIESDDPIMLLRFCTDELNTNFGIVDNPAANTPTSKQNGTLRDGVTDR